MGDDVPPDELNFPPQSRMNFGFPYCHGGNIPDPVFGQKHPCTEFVAPAMGLPAHVASLGMCFYEGNMFPTACKNQVFIAERGSWDRSVSTGYHIRLIHVEGNHASNYEVFAEGWLIGRFKWGRPVNALVMPDGALLVSDDYAGAVYRITYPSR